MAAIVIQEREKTLAKVLVAVVIFAFVAPNFAQEWSADYLNQESRRRENLESKVADLTERLAGIEDQRQLLRRFINDYRKWEGSGSLDDHKLIDWVRTMDAIKERRKLFQIGFNFGDQRQLNPDTSRFTDGSTVSMNLVEMRVEMDMLHDMDFLMFMESLDQGASALFFPTQCEIDRKSESFALQQRVNLTADCLIKWLAVRDPDRKAAAENGGGEGEGEGGSAQSGQAEGEQQGS